MASGRIGKHHDDYSVEGEWRDRPGGEHDLGRFWANEKQITDGKGRKPMPFMTSGNEGEADAVWGSKHGLEADERKKKTRKDVPISTGADLPELHSPQL